MSPTFLTDAEFQLFCDLIYRSCGIVFKPSSKLRMENKISTRIKYHEMSEFSEYLKYLNKRSPEIDKEIKILLDILTVNETFFFRNKTHFETLEKYIIPQIIENKISNMENKIKIWSAGCSTGQEAYSIAMVLDNVLAFKRDRFNISIYGTDISETSIQVARNGIYNNRRLDNVPKEYLEKYFVIKDDKIEVIDYIKNMVDFRYGNLNESPLFSDIDLIFCRNVMIYFDNKVHKKIADDFYRVMTDDGYLIIGHSETFQGVTDKFKFTLVGNGIVYRKNIG